MGTDGFGQIGAGVAEFELEAHGFGGDENVRKDDDGVDAEEAKRLQRDFDGEVGRLANFQKRVICADGAVFGEVAAGLPHHPDRKARKSFAAAGTEEEVLAIERHGSRGHLGPTKRIANPGDDCRRGKELAGVLWVGYTLSAVAGTEARGAGGGLVGAGMR